MKNLMFQEKFLLHVCLKLFSDLLDYTLVLCLIIRIIYFSFL